MSRTVPEWRGRSDDSRVPRSVYDRLYEKQEGKDAITGLPFRPGDKIIIDHIVPLKDASGGNRETNLQLITDETHKPKTAAEAKARAKERRIHERDRGYVRPKSKWQSRGFEKPAPQRTASRPIRKRALVAQMEE